MPLFATVIDTRRSTEIPESNSGADLAPGEIRVTFPYGAVLWCHKVPGLTSQQSNCKNIPRREK